MSTELKLRRDVAGDIDAMTPAEGEPIYDITNKRLQIGDGSTAGGIHLAAAADIQKQTFNYAAASGTDTLTLTLDPAIASYTTGLRASFKAAANNTGTATININGLGAKTIKRNGGADDLVADDLVAGGFYEIVYDGTNFQLLTNLSSIKITRKTSDETVNNSTTLQNDNHLLASVASNTTYHFKFVVIHIGNGTADFKAAITVPTGTALLWGMTNARVTEDSALGGAKAVDVSGTPIAMQGDTIRIIQEFTGTARVGGTSGNLQLQWTQNTATVVNTIVKADSFLMLWVT